ncbi:MAG: class I SAM-dependent methyltransferase, partial [Rhodanobacter sp.]
NVFFVAPGRWDLYRCAQCECAYLDPRPNEASIGKAYEVYYTHDGDAPRPAAGASREQRLKLALVNGYLNARYGTRRQPASKFGVLLAGLLPRQRQKRDAAFRFLPKPSAGQKLLDVGCGNGDFLLNARDACWDVVGIDSDPKAIEIATQRGLNARVGSIDLFADQFQCFDAITLSHVLEHLHQPKQAILAVHRLLRPGGIIFVDTPNINSQGATLWGKDWRGLEAPRHLVLFSTTGLVELLQSVGFVSVEAKRRTAVRKSIYLASLRMQAGRSPYDRRPSKLPLLMRIKLTCMAARADDDEFLTFLARKAGE